MFITKIKLNKTWRHFFFFSCQYALLIHHTSQDFTHSQKHVYSRGVRAELAAQRIALVGWDLGLGDKLSDLVSHASC